MKTVARIKVNKERKEYQVQEGGVFGNRVIETLGKIYDLRGYKQVEDFDDTENMHRRNLNKLEAQTCKTQFIYQSKEFVNSLQEYALQRSKARS